MPHTRSLGGNSIPSRDNLARVRTTFTLSKSATHLRTYAYTAPKPMENANPEVFESVGERPVIPEEKLDEITDEIDAREVFGTQ